MKILGIESSCDETAAAVVSFDQKAGLNLLSNIIASSVDLHAEYGGVVPEIAARSHLEYINPAIQSALSETQSGWTDIDAVAVTQGPGLGGSLLVGVLSARTLAILHDKPLYTVNHVLAHPYAAFFENQAKFPLLALIVSGGHSHLVLFENHNKYTVIGQTLDDAVGEAFDKVAKIIGLPYPGGPSIEDAAKSGNSDAYELPKARLKNPYDFSFSGLKTAVLRTAQASIGEDYRFPSHQVASRLSKKQKGDIAASFQSAASQTLVDALVSASKQYSPKSIVVAGGVAANGALRNLIRKRMNKNVIYPPARLCTDNAAMIAARATFQISGGAEPADPYTLEALPDLKM